MNINNGSLWPALVGLMLATVAAPQALGRNIQVVTSFYPVFVAALNVTAGVAGIEVHNMASGRVGCLHDYQLTSGDARHLAAADIFLANGSGMESFLEKIRRQWPQLSVLETSEGIPLLNGNPHVWVSPSGARQQVENIARALSNADPLNARSYEKNAAAYNAKLAALELRMKMELAPYAGRPIITFHQAFAYFARDFGLDLVGVVESEPGQEPRARELADTIDLVRAKHVQTLFAEPQYSGRSAAVIARETGAEVYQLDPVVTGPSVPEQARDAYLAAMEKNLATLRQALRR
ncbi:MAG: zinc ABC transporter substrate-binding protein [Chthoniobacterales bacterium]|jgi:zinc transport system substrate-binding protein